PRPPAGCSRSCGSSTPSPWPPMSTRSSPGPGPARSGRSPPSPRRSWPATGEVTMAEVCLEIPARVEYLVLARQVVAAAAAVEPRFQDERIDDLRIAVSEAQTDLSSSDRILIRCNLDDERIEVEVLDRSGGFDPRAVVSAPDADALNRLEFERGLGLPLMRTLADETEIHSGAGGTAVRLVVYRPGR